MHLTPTPLASTALPTDRHARQDSRTVELGHRREGRTKPCPARASAGTEAGR
jgi:hypothetical protein